MSSLRVWGGLRRLREVDELINQTRELLWEMKLSFDDPERFRAARSEWKRKTARLEAILPAATEPLD